MFRSQRSRFCTAQLKKRVIVIFAWFLAYLSESGLVFAPHKKRMFWGHTLKERGIVVFAWFQCFVWAFSYLYWVRVMPTIFTLHFHSSLSNRSDRTNRQPSCEHEVVNEMQFSDRQLHLTVRLSLLIRTGCTVAFSDRVS